MSIIQYQEFNSFSKQTIEKYRLKKGETAMFRLIGIKPDPHNPGTLLIPSSKGIHTQMRVFDVVDKNGKQETEEVDMMMIDRMEIGGKPKLKQVKFQRKTGGMIILSGDRPGDSDTYFYLMMSDERADKEGRNTTVVPVYEYIDTREKARERKQTRERKYEAMKIAKDLNDENVIEFGQAMAWDEKDPVILRDMIENFAETDPEDFLNRNADRNKDIRATIKKALDARVLVYDRSSWRFIMKADGSTVYAHPYDPKDGYIGVLTDWIVSHPNGKNMFDLLKNRLADKKPKKELAEA